MINFNLTTAKRVEDAFVARAGSMPIAGGTELLNWFRLGIASADHVIDVSRLAGLSHIEADGAGLRIGALATLADIGGHALVKDRAPVLSEACLAAASPQVRNRATIGGNILQKTRCEYFRAAAPVPWPCNKRIPGSGCAAREGINGRHAIFGWTDACVATQPSDPVVALAALGARVEIVGPSGRRDLLVAAFHRTQDEAEREQLDGANAETRLRPGEIIIGYRVPAGPRSAYVKVRERASYEYALVSAAAVIILDEGTIQSATLFLGSVAQKPWPLDAALAGLAPTRSAILPAVEASLGEARPLSGNGYKVRMAAGAATRAILEAAA